MKTYILLFALSICFYSTGIAQWRLVTSGTGADLDAIHFIDDEIGFCSGGFTNTLETTDGGETWTRGNSQGIRDFSFFDKNFGFGASIVSQSMTRTTDGGLNWGAITPPTSNSLWAVSATSASTAYFVGTGGVLWKTTDGGNRVTVGNTGTIKLLTDVIFTSASVGYIVVQTGEIKKTENEGRTWKTVYSDSEAIFTEMFFVDEHIGFVVGLNGNIIKTENAGESWTTLTSNSTNYLQGVNFFDAKNGIVVGSNGEILSTSDGGISWTTQSSGTTERLKDVVMLSPTKAIVIGDNGIILRNDLILDLTETVSVSGLLTYPNPVSNNLTISAREKINSIQIFNTSGALIIDNKFIEAKTCSFDFSNYDDGIYFILIRSEKGTSLKKVMK